MIDQLRSFFDRFPGSGVVSVYLFGSRATGAPHRESNVDIGTLLDRTQLPTPKDRFDTRLRLVTRLSEALRIGADRVDVVVLNDAPPMLARKIVTEGKRVHCRDMEADHAFRRDIQLRAADLKPFLHRMRRIKLEALAR